MEQGSGEIGKASVNQRTVLKPLIKYNMVRQEQMFLTLKFFFETIGTEKFHVQKE
jgi:hypothetical protein